MSFPAHLRIDRLPPDEQAPFSAWVFRQTRPVVAHELDTAGNPAVCAYVWDYSRWVAEGRPAGNAEPYAT